MSNAEQCVETQARRNTEKWIWKVAQKAYELSDGCFVTGKPWGALTDQTKHQYYAWTKNIMFALDALE